MAGFSGLTVVECVKAFDIVNPAIQQAMKSGIVNRQAGFLVVLDPATPWEPKYKKADERFEEEIVLFNNFFGHPDHWEYPYDKIALSKAFISWKTGRSSREVQLEAPYLYEAGMTKYGGSAVGPGGLVVAFSGVEEHFDQMFSEMMRAAIKGVCLHEMHKPKGVMNSADNFLTSCLTEAPGVAAKIIPGRKDSKVRCLSYQAHNFASCIKYQ